MLPPRFRLLLGLTVLLFATVLNFIPRLQLGFILLLLVLPPIASPNLRILVSMLARRHHLLFLFLTTFFPGVVLAFPIVISITAAVVALLIFLPIISIRWHTLVSWSGQETIQILLLFLPTPLPHVIQSRLRLGLFC